MGRLRPHRLGSLVLVSLLLVTASVASAGSVDDLHLSLETEPRPPQVQRLRQRPKPLIEWGERFNAPGRLSKGLKLPGGAVWRPQLLVFGTLRSALQSLEGPVEISEWITRLDLHAQLRLSGTERLLVSLRPLNDDTQHSGYFFSGDTGWQEQMNSQLRALFFEGDFGELLPVLDRSDRRPIDLGFSVGRQPLALQEGMLLDDLVDSLGVSKNSLRPRGSSNLRLLGLWAWGGLDRRVPGGSARRLDEGAQLFGLSAALDLPVSTFEIDAVHVESELPGASGNWLGVSATQRLGRTASTFRVVLSEPTEGEGLVGRGRVLTSELSWTPRRNEDIVYFNAFAVDGRFSSAARDAERGGPLGRMGILFEAPGIGRLPMSLSADATEVWGGAFGWQHFMKHGRRQFVLEGAGRRSTRGTHAAEAGVGLRFQQALLNRFLVQLDAFAAVEKGLAPRYGGRLEFQVKF
ncbi:MAG: hypothetical protein AAF533_28480 [Acidobacteriota bacterium]